MLALDYSSWIGRAVTRHDTVSERLTDSFHQTLAPHLFVPIGESLGMLGLHWCLAPAIHPPDRLGPDGAELKGLFLPPVTLPRRMWAGGQIEFFEPLAVDDQITRNSVVGDITLREGASGQLCFVAVQHEVLANGVLALRERHDILFRAAGAVTETKPPQPRPVGGLQWRIDATAVLLFRYSALTFNGHRIHYDLPYAQAEEGYQGLLVHGPLQATLALNQAASVLGYVPRTFTYRCLAPLTAPQRFEVVSWLTDKGAETAIYNAAGVRTLAATSTR